MSSYHDLMLAAEERKRREKEATALQGQAPPEIPAPDESQAPQESIAPTESPALSAYVERTSEAAVILQAPARREPAPPAPAREAPAQPGTADGYTPLSNWIMDEFMPRLDQYEQAVMYRLYRLTLGFRRTTCRVSYGKIAEKARVSENTVVRACKRLVGYGYISTQAVIDGRVTARGLEIEILPPALPPETVARQRAARQAPTREVVMTDHDKGREQPLSDPIRVREARRRELLKARPDATAREIEDALDHWGE